MATIESAKQHLARAEELVEGGDATHGTAYCTLAVAEFLELLVHDLTLLGVASATSEGSKPSPSTTPPQ